ncbi:MAG: tetratricopeptide repeat protein [Donghicola eburneus]|nr:tetratricopeptide repeat protein [Donghicola eburneus]MCI5041358.1 tetratricopeptide repeat protein [Donghicola eburneus]
MARWAFGILVIASLAACESAPADLPDNPYAPATDYSAEPVDQLLVGDRLMDAGEFELALQAYTRAAGNRGMTPEVLGALGAANLRLGRLGQAETQLRKSVAEDNDNYGTWNNLGVVLMEADRTSEAVQVFRQAYALSNGQSDEIRDNLRKALAKFEDAQYDEVENTYKLVRQGTGEYLLKTTPE